MKRPEDFELDKSVLRNELADLGKRLGDPTKELAESRDVLPFFKTHRNLAALIGWYKSGVGVPDLIKTELEVFGDCACDLAVGEKATGLFCFVEFEEARKYSVFGAGTRGMSDWSARLEHGFSQIVDWFYLLADQRGTQQFRSFFATDLADYCGLLVVGRDAFLTPDQKHRLRWRSQNTLVAGKPVFIITFDELFETLRQRVELVTSPVKKKRRTAARRRRT